MKSVISKILVALGAILILAAILWWAIAGNALIKLPDDLDSTTHYEGEITYHVNPGTNEPLAEGEEIFLPIEIERVIASDTQQFDSETGVLKETVIIDTGPLTETEEFAYVLDRKTLENIEDDRAFAWVPENIQNREGSYYPSFTFDTSKDKTYMVWRNEINDAREAHFLSEEEIDGLIVYNFGGAIELEENKEVAPFRIEMLELPSEMTFDDLKPWLAAMGVDVDGLLALASQALSAEDMQALDQLLQETFPVKYYAVGEQAASIEPRTGSPVDVYKNVLALYMDLDLASLDGLFALLAKYSDDPVLGPALAQLSELQTQLGEMEPQVIFEYNYHQTEESVKESVAEAKDGAGLISLVEVYIPWSLLIVGVLLLIVGLLIGGGGKPQAE